jgi:hypothetical protein
MYSTNRGKQTGMKCKSRMQNMASNSLDVRMLHDFPQELQRRRTFDIVRPFAGDGIQHASCHDIVVVEHIFQIAIFLFNVVTGATRR